MGVLAEFKNRPRNILINGGFEIDQRYGGGTIAGASKYSLDRWFFGHGADVVRTLETNKAFKYSARVTASASGNVLVQRIESAMVHHLRGKTLTLSLKAILESGSISLPLKTRVGRAHAIDDFSAPITVYDADLEIDGVLDGTWKTLKYSFVVTDDMATNGFYIQFGDFGSATNVVRYAQAMLSEGEAVAEFERAGICIEGELALCQRYYEKTSYLDNPANSTVNAVRTLGNQTSNELQQDNQWFMVRKRTIPIPVIYSGSNGAAGYVYNVGTTSNKGASAVDTTETKFRISSSGLSPNNIVIFNWAADAEL